jgi:hypothetical protein
MTDVLPGISDCADETDRNGFKIKPGYRIRAVRYPRQCHVRKSGIAIEQCDTASEPSRVSHSLNAIPPRKTAGYRTRAMRYLRAQLPAAVRYRFNLYPSGPPLAEDFAIEV